MRLINTSYVRKSWNSVTTYLFPQNYNFNTDNLIFKSIEIEIYFIQVSIRGSETRKLLCSANLYTNSQSTHVRQISGNHWMHTVGPVLMTICVKEPPFQSSKTVIVTRIHLSVCLEATCFEIPQFLVPWAAS